jgi:hypothetical protein
MAHLRAVGASSTERTIEFEITRQGATVVRRPPGDVGSAARVTVLWSGDDGRVHTRRLDGAEVPLSLAPGRSVVWATTRIGPERWTSTRRVVDATGGTGRVELVLERALDVELAAPGGSRVYTVYSVEGDHHVAGPATCDGRVSLSLLAGSYRIESRDPDGNVRDLQVTLRDGMPAIELP